MNSKKKSVASHKCSLKTHGRIPIQRKKCGYLGIYIFKKSLSAHYSKQKFEGKRVVQLPEHRCQYYFICHKVRSWPPAAASLWACHRTCVIGATL